MHGAFPGYRAGPGHEAVPGHGATVDHETAADHRSAADQAPVPEVGLIQPGAVPQISVIEGLAGVGKTALAVHAARAVSSQYPDGTYYLNLHTHDPGHPALDADEALHRLLRMLTARPPSSPTRSASGPPCCGRS